MRGIEPIDATLFAEAEIAEQDALEFLSAQPDASLNLIYTSPPYADARQKQYGGIPPDEFVEWFSPIAEQMQRALAQDGSFVLNIKEKIVDGQRSLYVIDLIQHLVREQGWLWAEEYIWHKSSSFPGKWKTHFRDAWERCLHFVKQPEFKMLQDSVRMPASQATLERAGRITDRDRGRTLSPSGTGFGRKMENWEGKDWAYPSNVLYGPPELGQQEHPAPQPGWLPAFFIELFTETGDVVCDPFAGSGTTLREALRLLRQARGCDINPEYVRKLSSHQAGS